MRANTPISATIKEAASNEKIHELREHAADFLAREALILDERRFRDWFELLDDEIDYDVPIRIAMRNYADEFPQARFASRIARRISRPASRAWKAITRGPKFRHPARCVWWVA
ncbi:aromatic-ring-hydroxylating dioxygenase subunit beta [Pseudomonas sp. TH10]|uniref:aromatic-ring-hydroxylating dioxygenase subunit beta n=1 Tax=Pseudomonas sp. TH10 TaxID=2796376 RepID=UPI0027DDEEF2|nr:aromatic-ring-hydroxylating dioxygenase subunit beta [Pseudomonas sp. TH10]